VIEVAAKSHPPPDPEGRQHGRVGISIEFPHSGQAKLPTARWEAPVGWGKAQYKAVDYRQGAALLSSFPKTLGG
jgi:hypothetical protein